MSNKEKLLKEIRNLSLILAGAFIIVLLFNSKVLAKVPVEQSSMESTLFSKQQLLVDKFSYNFCKPKRGDIVVFYENEKKGSIVDDFFRSVDNMAAAFDKGSKDKHSSLIKRVIGVEGDIINIKGGYVYLNGKLLNEPYSSGDTFAGEFKLPVTVGKNQLFVLGDNRIVSYDSRSFGLININQVEGKAVFRIYPINKIGKIK